METIINPMWFYLLGMCNEVKVSLLFWGTVVHSVVFLLKYVQSENEIECIEGNFSIYSSEFKKEKNKIINKYSKSYFKILISLVICWCFGIAIPSESTLTKMLIASQVTTNRVEKSVEVIEKVYNDIITKIDKE